jgi:hypothetical protein
VTRVNDNPLGTDGISPVGLDRPIAELGARGAKVVVVDDEDRSSEGRCHCAGPLSGSETVKVVPRPGALATEIAPPSWITICWEIQSPRPSPP